MFTHMKVAYISLSWTLATRAEENAKKERKLEYIGHKEKLIQHASMKLAFLTILWLYTFKSGLLISHHKARKRFIDSQKCSLSLQVFRGPTLGGSLLRFPKKAVKQFFLHNTQSQFIQQKTCNRHPHHTIFSMA